VFVFADVFILFQHAMEYAIVGADVAEGCGLSRRLPNNAANCRLVNIIINGGLLLVQNN
jgi:hypothetical protein